MRKLVERLPTLYTDSNAHQVRGQKVKVSRPINAETESVSPYELQIW